MVTKPSSQISKIQKPQTPDYSEKKRMARESLHRVDQFIKAKELEKALEEIRRVKRLDPQNVYALAFEERIQALLAEQKKSQERQEILNQTSAPSTPSTASLTQEIPDGAPIFESIQYFHSPISQSVSGAGKIGDVQHYQERPKVLIIDDDSDLLSVLSIVIESGGFEVIALNTSDAAYDLLKHIKPDIILCDVYLETSTMGGFDFFEKIQEIENVKYIPFVFLSGLSYEILFRTAKELGVDDYLTKPIDTHNLLLMLHSKIKRYEKLRKSLSSDVYDSVAAYPV